MRAKQLAEAKTKAEIALKAKNEADSKAKAAEAAKLKIAEEEVKKLEAEAAKLAEDAAKAVKELDSKKKAIEDKKKAAELDAQNKTADSKKKAADAMKELDKAKEDLKAAEKKAEEAENASMDLTRVVGGSGLPLAALYLEKYTATEIGQQIVDAFNEVADNPDDRNIVILGRQGFGSTGVGEDFARSFYDMGICNAKTIAKIKAQALNKLGKDALVGAMEKLKGGCMVVENAGLIRTDRLEEVVKLSQADANDVVIILTGEIDSVTRLITSNENIESEFTNLIQLNMIDNDDMIGIGKGYCVQRGYMIAENLESKLSNLLLAMEVGNIDRLMKAVDDAIARCDAREKASGTPDKRLLIPEDFV